MKLVLQVFIILLPVAVTQRPVDYTKFLHSTEKHKSACNTCHKPPTKNWTKASAFPDVADFPDHDACVSCHRAQFFRGARPAICTGCHLKTSPRDDARFTFRKPDAKSQFMAEFPHDRHQDVIAFNPCTTCHAQSAVFSTPPAGGWVDSYVPPPATFKSAPTDHSSCFNCHWKSQEPVATNCNGCHKPVPATFVAAAIPTRISSRFMHEGGGEKKLHIAECTTCHINITKARTLLNLKPDVPITACTECHNKVGAREDLNKELSALDKNPAFVCAYCHTSNVGKLDPPASHYLIAQRPQIKRIGNR